MPFVTRERDALQDAQSLYELARDLLTIEEPDTLLDAIVLRSLSILGGDRGFLVFKEANQRSFKVIKNWSPEELLEQKEPVSKTLVEEVFNTNQLLHGA